MVRIREGDHQQEGLIVTASRFEPLNRTICDIGRGIMFFRNFRADRLRNGEVVIELFVTPTQSQSFRCVLLDPFEMTSACVEAMPHNCEVFFETIKR